MRYQASELEVPSDIEAALQMFDFPDPRLTVLRQIQARGPKAILDQDSVFEIINSVGPEGWNEEQLANALLFMALYLLR